MKAMSLIVAVVALATAGFAHAASIDHEFVYSAGDISLSDQQGWTSVEMRGAVNELTPGRPDLPVVYERIELPPGTRVTGLEVLGVETAALGVAARVAPALVIKPYIDDGSRTDPDPAIYQRAGFGDEPAVVLGYQGSMRGHFYAHLAVRAVRWDPATGRLQRVARVRVRLQLGEETGDVVVRERVVPEWESEPYVAPARGRVAVMTAVERRTAKAQPFKPMQIPSVVGSPVEYLIVTSDELAGEFQRLADWKTQSGVPAVVRTVSFIRQQYPFGTDDADKIRMFLRDAYARWGTKWVLLGGDTDVIPARIAYTNYYTTEHIATDLYYSCLDGNWNADGDSTYGEGLFANNPSDLCDMLPEVWVGRAPVVTVAQAQLFVNKTFQYERTPVGDYEHKVLFFAEVLFPQDWVFGNPRPSLDGAELVEECLPSVLEDTPPLQFIRLYQNYTDTRWMPGSLELTRAALLGYLNQGYNQSVHVGHGFRNVMSVGDGSLTNADAFALTNGNRLTNLYACNCTSNAIDFPCIGEAFMLAPNGGAVTSIGSTRFDFPTTGRRYQKEFFRLVYDDSVTALGEAQGRAKLPFMTIIDFDAVDRWTHMTLLMLGDPELRMWTGPPRTLTVLYPPSIAASETTVTVNVKISGTPLANARVTVLKAGDEYRSGLTDALGNISLDFRCDSVGPAQLTVTGYDCRPFQATINVTPATDDLLVEGAPIVDDNSSGGTTGNSNGLIEAGETVDLRIPVTNRGVGNAGSVNGIISCDNPQVTILNPNNSYGTIAAAATADGLGWYRIQLPRLFPDQTEFTLALSMVDNGGNHFVEDVRITARGPEPRHFSHIIVDAGGNEDGRPDPGEAVSYQVRLRNLGTGVANGVTARLRNYDGLATISDSIATFGDIAPGAEVLGDPFAFTLSSTDARFELRISNTYGLLDSELIDVKWPTAPGTPDLLGAAGAIRLTWQHNLEPDLMGYSVYRSLSAVGPYTAVTSVPTDRTSYFMDSGLLPLTVYYYKVSAVDSSGNESGQTAPVSASTNPPHHTIFPVELGQNTPASVAIARIYQPGQLDIVAGADLLYVFHPDGTAPVDADGSVLTPGDFSLLGTYYAAGPSVGDIDGTGGMDIVATTWTSKKVYAFDQLGQVKPGWPFDAGIEMWGCATLVDLDNNGTKEVLFPSNGNRFFALRSNGTEWMDGDANPLTNGVFKDLGVPTNFGTAAVADLDNNGQVDIVYGANNGVLNAWRPNGDNLPGFPVILSGAITNSAAIGRLDGPGDLAPEIAILTSSDSLYVIQSNGARRPGFPVGVKISGTSKQPSPALGDIDGDGFLDVVVASTDGKLYVYNRNGLLLPAFTNVRYSSETSIASESSPVIADINGDGINDIVIGDEENVLNGFSGTGAKLPGFPIQLGAEVRGTPALGDIDGDGLTEIVAAGWDKKLYVWDYDLPFSPAGPPPWPQFHHDAMRTGYASAAINVDVPPAPGAAPARLELAAPWPNPAGRSTRFSYDIPAAFAGQRYELAVYDLTGRLVRVVDSGIAAPGRFTVDWNLRSSGGTVGTGVYFVQFALGAERRSRKLIVLP